MVEFVGAVAAIPQLVKYSFSAANAVPDFARRMRKAPVTQRQWDDQTLLLSSLSQAVHANPAFTNTVPSGVIDRLDSDLNKVLPALRNLRISAADSRMTRMRKRARILRKEAEMKEDLQLILQRSLLCSHVLMYVF